MLNKEQKKFQQKKVNELRADYSNYEDAAIYTVLLDLVQGNGIDHIQEVLLDVANDWGLEVNISIKPKKK